MAEAKLMDSQKKCFDEEIYLRYKNFENALRKLKDRTVLIVSGPNGCGKSVLALQLQEEYCNLHQSNFYGDLILCDSKETLRGELLEFVRRVPLNVDPHILARGKFDEIFAEVFEQMNNSFGDKTRFLIFDDVALESDVLSCIDQALFSMLDKKPVDDPLRKSWKIVITTRVDSQSDWLDKCNFFNPKDFLRVNGLYDKEVPLLLKQSERGNQFTTEDVTLIKKIFGTRPLMLNVVKKKADNDTAKSPSEVLHNFVADIRRLGIENNDVSGLFVSIKRLVKDSTHGEEFKELIMMLTMFHETNIPEELLISCAEVIVDCRGVDGVEKVGKKAAILHSDFIDDMRKCSLFRKPLEHGTTSLLSFHKLIKQGMKLYSATVVDRQRDLEIAQKALLALTRVMPRDGRDHNSHRYLFMYRHAQTLLKEVEKLTQDGDLVSRTETPLLMLLTCILRLSMGNCLRSMKYPAEDALKHVNDALTTYSKLFVDRDYDQLMALIPKEPEPLQKAKILLKKCYDAQLPTEIAQWLEQLPLYLLLTDRDKRILFPDEQEWNFMNGHLDNAQIQKARHHKKVLQPGNLAKFYAVEVLADVYFMAARICGNDDGLEKHATEYYDAALFLYRKIKQRSGVTLLAEIVLEREMLNKKLQSKDLSADTLDEMIGRWEVLRKTDEKAFECGLMRANFKDDPYNDFLCNEGLIRCKGRKCADERDKDNFNKVDKLFKEHIAKAKQQKDDPKLQSNNQTISKAYRYYGEFLLQCGHAREAVEAIIDSLRYLSKFLNESAKETLFPELDITCGKAKPLWELLEKAYVKYDEGHSVTSVLGHDGTDDPRMRYIQDCLIHWLSQHDSKDEIVVEDEKVYAQRSTSDSHSEESAAVMTQGDEETCVGIVLSKIYCELEKVITKEKVPYFSIHQDSTNFQNIVIRGENVEPILKKLTPVLDPYRSHDFSIETKNISLKSGTLPVLEDWVIIRTNLSYTLADEDVSLKSVVELVLTAHDTNKNCGLHAATTAHSFMAKKDSENPGLLAQRTKKKAQEYIAEHCEAKKPYLVVSDDSRTQPIEPSFSVYRYWFPVNEPENWLVDFAMFPVSTYPSKNGSTICPTKTKCSNGAPSTDATFRIHPIEVENDLDELVGKKVVCKGMDGIIWKDSVIPKPGELTYGVHLSFILKGDLNHGDCGSLVYLKTNDEKETDILGMFFGTLKSNEDPPPSPPPPPIHHAIVVYQALKQIRKSSGLQYRPIDPVVISAPVNS